MRISLKNIGKVKEANIEIRGITVIGGENNTGKSTVGKALYATFKSFLNVKYNAHQEKRNSLRSGILNLLQDVQERSELSISDVTHIAERVMEEFRTKESSKEDVRKFLFYILNLSEQSLEVDKEKISYHIERIANILSISDEDFLKIYTQRVFNGEFNQQINNILEIYKGEVILEIKDKKSIINFSQDRVLGIEKNFDISTEAMYLDDPFIIDSLPPKGFFSSVFGTGRYNGHKDRLRSLIYSRYNNNLVDELVAESRLKCVLDKISSACHGKVFFKNSTELMYKQDDTGLDYRIANLSTGLKTFAIIQSLLLSGMIKDGGLIILDEPEIHLHPEWQLIFAELIVMLQKEFGLHILLNTHSPYFLQAIEVFAETYGISDKCDYYLSYNKDNESYFEHVNGEVDKIYAKLARPLLVLDSLRYKNE